MRRGREFEIRGAEQRKVRILYRLLGHWRNSEVWEQFVQYMTSFIVIVPIKWKKRQKTFFSTESLKNCNESQSDEVNGVGSILVWSGGMDFEEIGQKQNRSF